MKLLAKGIYFANEISLLHGNILLHAIVALQLVSQVLDMVYPGKWVPIQKNRQDTLSCSSLLAKDQTFSLRFLRIRVSGEFQVPRLCKILTYLDH